MTQSVSRRAYLACRCICMLLLAILSGCGGGSESERPARTGFEPPVVINATSPMEYPLELFESGVEGVVILRLFVSEEGELVADSTQVATGSGNPALDSAALAGVSQLRFAPAIRDSLPVAAVFLQPVHFRQPTPPVGEPS